jgi:RES domain-containing protein
VKLKRVLDLTQPDALEYLGITVERLTSANFVLPQATSHRARQLGIQGLIVPSATTSGHNVIIFEDNLAEGCTLEIIEVRGTVIQPES